MKQSKKIAVTGGIGSGKSTFCAAIKEMGYPVVSCDDVYREIVQTEEYLSALKEEFPDCVIDGALDRSRLSALVFADKTALRRLNALSHPRIMTEVFKRMEGHTLAFAEVPLLFEGGFANLFDEVIVVMRPREVRISSVMERSDLTREEVEARIQKQFDYDGELPANCMIVHNDGNKQDLLREAQNVLTKLNE